MSEPSKYFRQHHAVEAPAIDQLAFRPYWRVRTRLDQLLVDRAISFAVWRAGVSFRILAELVLAEHWPAKWFGADRAEKTGLGFDVTMAGRMDAIRRLHELRGALGGFAIDLLEAHVVDDVTWLELGRRYGVHSKTARSWTVVALRALASVIWQ